MDRDGTPPWGTDGIDETLKSITLAEADAMAEQLRLEYEAREAEAASQDAEEAARSREIMEARKHYWFRKQRR